MRITYIDHSGFLLETEKVSFLFDYYRGEIPVMNQDNPIVVFVSHKHPDHYNPEIFHLVHKYPHIHYVLSKDVPVKWQMIKYKEEGIDPEEHITVVRKNTTQTLSLFNGEALEITALKSTDEGVAYLLSCSGHTYYHAGDLNLWLWEGETKQYNENMARAYYRELEKLKGLKIDVAFVPLDARQGKDAFCGMESFMEYTESNLVFPMHFWGEYEIIDRFLKKHPEFESQIQKLQTTGQSMFFDCK